jgi:hypothetical protein
MAVGQPTHQTTGGRSIAPAGSHVSAGTSGARGQGEALPTELGAAPITLADCAIEPTQAPVTYAGWGTAETLGIRAVPLPAGQPVYAIVTAGTAEWVGWHETSSGPIFPRPVGRLGCIHDPVSRTERVIAMPDTWTRPAMIDDCPASPTQQFAGYREIGGPGAFVLLPTNGSSWWADDASVEFLARMAPAPPPGAVVTAWAVPLGPGARFDATVISPPTRLRSPPSQTHSIIIRGVEFPTAGCWALNMAVDDVVVGSAIVPIRERPAGDPAAIRYQAR